MRAPQGTAFARSSVLVPRLTGPADGTSVYVSLAALIGEPTPAAAPDTVSEVTRGRRDRRGALDGRRLADPRPLRAVDRRTDRGLEADIRSGRVT